MVFDESWTAKNITELKNICESGIQLVDITLSSLTVGWQMKKIKTELLEINMA